MPHHNQRDKGNMDPSGKTTLVFVERFGNPVGGGKGVLCSEGFCPTLTATIPYVCVEESVKEAIVFQVRFSGVNCYDNVSPTLEAGMGTSGTLPLKVCVEESDDECPSRTTRRLHYPPLSSGTDIFPTLSTALCHWNSGGQEAYTGQWYIVEEELDG